MDEFLQGGAERVAPLLTTWGLRVVGAVVGIAVLGLFGIETRVLQPDGRVLGDPEPLVAVAELGDSSVNLVARPWRAASDYWALRFDLTRKIKDELEAASCSIPFPRRDIHIAPKNGVSAPVS